MPIYLAATGSALLVGSFFFISILSSMSLLIFLSTIGHKFSIRTALIFQSFSLTVGLLILSQTRVPALILLAAVFSVTNWAPGGGSGTGAGPYNTTLNLFLSEKVAKSSRTFIFSVSAILGTLSYAFGAYFLSFAKVLNVEDISGLASDVGRQESGLFVLGAIMQLLSGIILFAVSKKKTSRDETSYLNEAHVVPKISEGEVSAKTSLTNVMVKAHKFVIAEFLNGFGNGLFLRLIPLWFFVKFALGVETIGEIVALAGVITASFVLLSAHFERIAGSTNSIFLARSAYAFLVISMALSPSLPVAISLYYVSLIVSRIAVPIQQSLVFTRIPAEDWTRASGMVGVANSLGGSLGPLLGAYLLLEVNVSLAFIVALPFLFFSALIYRIGFRSEPRSSHKQRVM
jgi:hypothetical protein